MTTPVDEDAFFHQGIHERFDIAEKMGGYFGTDEVQRDVVKSAAVEADMQTLDEFEVEKCMVALGQPENVSSWEDGWILGNAVLSLGIFSLISF